ncbi:MAG: hypothetical protein RJA53_714 [Bacteroidota bacterium]|jgi:hypothetical protein
MIKALFLILFSFIFMLIWFGESRSFFCLNNSRCITVWKTFNNVCYIIPGKYFGFIKPSTSSFIQTTNINNVDIIWNSNFDTILVNTDDSNLIVHNFSKSVRIIKYSQNKSYNDSLFTYFNGNYHRYKKGLPYIYKH